MKTPTPHIKALKGAFAKTVLMPGDPVRSEWIAKTFFENLELVNDIRGVNGYTGTYKGHRISVMASGMGMPSIGIYSHELYNAYDVQNIIRVGTAGSYQEYINLKDIIVAIGACTTSNYAFQYHLPGTFAPIASYELIKKTDVVAQKLQLNQKIHYGNILSTDVFYGDVFTGEEFKKMGVLGVEMESAALYMEAARAGKNALTLVTVSDNIPKGEKMSPEDRAKSLKDMVTLALEVAVLYDEEHKDE